MEEKCARHNSRAKADAALTHTVTALIGLNVMLGCIAISLVVFPGHRSAKVSEIPPEQRNIVLRPDPLPELAVPHPPALPLEPIKGEDRYHSMIVRVAERHRVDPALVKAVIRAESAYDHKAVSHRGAIGLMQIIPKPEDGFIKFCFRPQCP